MLRRHFPEPPGLPQPVRGHFPEPEVVPHAVWRHFPECRGLSQPVRQEIPEEKVVQHRVRHGFPERKSVPQPLRRSFRDRQRAAHRLCRHFAEWKSVLHCGMRPLLHLLLLPVVLVVFTGSGGVLRADEPASPPTLKTVRVLTVGNSFSRNAVKHLGGLVDAVGHRLVLGELIIGGASFEVHWTKWLKAEKNPADPAGQYTLKRNLKQWLQAEPWDYVTIQQASIKSHDLATYRPFAPLLHAFIREHSPTAQVLIHQTWAYRVDDPRFSVKEPKPGEPKTQLEMHRGLSNAYRTIAAELKAQLIPVGDAFHLADTDPQWGFKPDASFNPKTAKPPALPDQTHSLHIGWAWKKQKDGSTKLQMDGHHANLAGEYLGACVWLEVLFGQSAVGNPFVPKGLDAAHAKFLQETAHRAVTEARARS